MEFEWDDQKNNINIEKHGIDFDFAKEIFSGVWISKPDNRRDYGEERLIALGLLGEFVLVAVYTLREQKIRLISTRRANAEERRIYYEYVERGTIKYTWSDERF
ncbi:MAG: BrnT family toxin [Microcystis panniformis]